jgi:pimeloyl-ACP methyl ester carboxylesterase/SAM-dependent methyltransferase
MVSTQVGRTAKLSALVVAATIVAAAPQQPSTQQTPAREPDVFYVPTPPAVVDGMLRLAHVTAQDVVYDLGCGDGRIPIAAAQKYGARGVGIDIDPKRIAEATENAKAAGVSDRVTFKVGDLFEADIHDATVVTLYLLPSLNERLMPKLKKELRPGTRIVSHAFDMGPSWPPESREEVSGKSIYLWTIKPPGGATDEQTLREHAGVYQWAPNAFVYLQLWNEFVGFDKPAQLVAFGESGQVRTLYPTERDRFVAGPGMALSTPIESRIEFVRDAAGKIVSLTWTREGASPRTARRVDIEKREDVRFSNGAIKLAGTLVSPSSGARHSAVILVHGSGPENREYMLPWARFLIRHGIAVLGYDKRGVGESSGDWNRASFQDLAGDVVAAIEYLKTRGDIDQAHIGLLGISQAGWVMPLAAVRAKDLAFLISISGAGVPAAETTIDQARNEMTMNGMRSQVVDNVIHLMKLQYEFARSGSGWDQYSAAREQMVARMGAAPKTFPATQDDPYWEFIRRLYFYDPAPTLRQLQTPTLAIWGELDNNIVAEKNKAAWEAALKAGRNKDYTLAILLKGDHAQWAAKTGSNAEMPSLQGFVPDYFSTVQNWLATRIPGFVRGK